MDAALLFLTFSVAYIVFMVFAYRVAKAMFPRVETKEEDLAVFKSRAVRKRV